MAIFMDRHDLSGETAADVVEAHRKDLEIQDQYGVKFLTYWFDYQRGTAFCLIDAPDKETAQCVHREAHGFVASEVVEGAKSSTPATALWCPSSPLHRLLIARLRFIRIFSDTIAGMPNLSIYGSALIVGSLSRTATISSARQFS